MHRMTPIPDYHDLLCDFRPKYQHLTPEQQSTIRILVQASFTGAYLHKHTGIHGKEVSNFFDWKTLYEGLGRGYPNLINITHRRVRGPVGFSFSDRVGKESTMHEDLFEAIEDFCRDSEPRYLRNEDTGQLIDYRPRGNAVYKNDVNNRRRKSTLQLPPTIRVNTEALKTAEGIFRAYLKGDESLRPLIEMYTGCRDLPENGLKIRLRQCQSILKGTRNHVTEEGTLIHRYVENRNGRLTGKGVHLTTGTKTVRRIALGGMDLWDYDFEACHPTILHHLARQGGYEAGAIEEYVRNKVYVREMIAQDLGVPVSMVKEALNAIFYGVSLAPHKKSSLYTTFGCDLDATRRFIEHNLVVPLSNERKAVRDTILRTAPTRARKIRNPLGREMDVEGKKSWSLLSFVATGMEALCLDLAVNFLTMEQGARVELLCYDGWISEKVNVDRVRDHIEDTLGINLRISTSPIPNPPSFPPTPTDMEPSPVVLKEALGDRGRDHLTRSPRDLYPARR